MIRKDCRGKRNVFNIGDKYNKLTIIKHWVEKPNNSGGLSRMCECLCECGKTTIVRGRRLRSGETKSCGCLLLLCNNKSFHWRGYGEISSCYFTRIKHLAKRRGIKFNLTNQEIWELFLKQNRKCALSGVYLQFAKVTNSKTEELSATASLDRIDSNGHYTIDNVQWIHKDVNGMKMALNQDKFIKWCKIITKNQEKLLD